MWLVLALLTFLAVAFVIYPLIRRAPKPVAEEVYGATGVVQRANVVLFKEQLADFDRQLLEGDIDDAQYAELVAEQKRLLLADASGLVDSEVKSGTDSGVKDTSTSETKPAVDDTSLSTSPTLTTANTPKSEASRGAWLIMASMLLVPLLAFSLYQMLGASDDVNIAELLEHRANAFSTEGRVTEEYAVLGKKIQHKIARRLQSKPDHVFYQVTLARLQMEDNNFESARESYQQALRWSPDDAELMAEYAQVLYFLADSKFEGEPGAALDRALSLDPNNRTALGLQGIRAFGEGNYALAMTSWQTALKTINPASQQAQALQSGIFRARKMLGDQSLSDKASDENLPVLEVKVSLSQQLKANPDQSVYVFAREWQGRPMPLAVVKLSVADLPTSVILDDSMAMPGGKRLSSARAIQIVARVSSTGSAIPSEGDFEGVSGEIAASDLMEGASALIDGKKQEIPVLIDRKL